MHIVQHELSRTLDRGQLLTEFGSVGDNCWRQQRGRTANYRDDDPVKDHDSRTAVAAKKRQLLDPIDDRSHQHRNDRGEHEDEQYVGQL